MNRNAELQEAIEQIDIEAWMDREGVRYRTARGSSGRQLNVKECPSCGNSNWKVYINAETGLGNCFHGDCEARFNRWSFIKAYLGGDNRATVQHVKAVAGEQGWRPPKLVSAPVKLTNADLVLPPSLALPIGGRNLKYLDHRNITGPIASYFKLRYCHDSKFLYRDEGRVCSQDYSKRIIIPVFDLEGNLVSFQGRDITGEAEKKYLFPPGFASTGTHLYNGHNAVGAEHICIGEGVFDVAAIKIALDQDQTLRDVVPIGTFGKSLSHGHEDSQLGKIMQLKAKGLKQVTFMWDAEEKAIDAAIDAGLRLHGVGLVVRLAILPEGCDPNEVPAETVRQAFWQARAINPGTATMLRLRKVAFLAKYR